ncbi:hypothetical protein B0H14DRAFT_2578283 [Mycena olivaceomarginata]|nr:hypothetical protein B0H14DRAFT_2578283 [Mycena olivaceomarginata]
MPQQKSIGPASIPLDPVDSTYHFGLDPDDVKEEGATYAFNRALEVAFQTHSLCGAQLVFKERGKRLVALEKFIAQFMKDGTLQEARMHQTRWIERLITAAKDSGAKIPAKRPAATDSDDGPEARPKKVPRQSITIDLTEDDIVDDSKSASSSSRINSPSRAPVTSASPLARDRPSSEKLLPAPQQQGTLFQFGCKQIDAEQAAAQQKKVLEEKRDAMRAAAEREKTAESPRSRDKDRVKP